MCWKDSGTLQDHGSAIGNPFHQFRNSSVTSLIAGYNFTSRAGISINVPYIHRTFRRTEGFVVEEGSESGLGDLSLLGRFVVLTRREHEYSYSLSLLGGVEFPTGDSDGLQEEVNEVEVPGAPPSGVHGDDLALGSGSFDGIVGLAAQARWRRLFFNADAQYFLRTRGDFGYRFGNEMSIAAGPGVYFLFNEEMTLALQGAFTYETKARDRIAGVKRDDGLSLSWYISPGIAFTHGEHFSATLNVDIPLRLANRDIQVVPDYRLRGGVGWNF